MTSGVLFSCASIIFGEFYFSNLRSLQNLSNKALAKIKHSTVSDDKDSATDAEDSENEHVADDHVPNEFVLRRSERQRAEPNRYGEWVMTLR